MGTSHSNPADNRSSIPPLTPMTMTHRDPSFVHPSRTPSSTIHPSLALCSVPSSSYVPYSHGSHARDANECIGYHSVKPNGQFATVAAKVDTLNLCATQHPAPFVTVSRRTRLLQDHSDQTRYIIGMIILITFFSAQAI